MTDSLVVDPAGVAPASLGTNANMLLHTPRAQVHEFIIKQKRRLLQGILFVVPNKLVFMELSAFN